MTTQIEKSSRLLQIFSLDYHQCPLNYILNKKKDILQCNESKDSIFKSVCPSNASHIYKLLSVIHFSSGNCLGIRDDGNLNAYKCEKFVSGCPDDDYSSSEIHKCKYLLNYSIVLLTYVLFNPTHFPMKSSTNYEDLLVYLYY